MSSLSCFESSNECRQSEIISKTCSEILEDVRNETPTEVQSSRGSFQIKNDFDKKFSQIKRETAQARCHLDCIMQQRKALQKEVHANEIIYHQVFEAEKDSNDAHKRNMQVLARKLEDLTDRVRREERSITDVSEEYKEKKLNFVHKELHLKKLKEDTDVEIAKENSKAETYETSEFALLQSKSDLNSVETEIDALKSRMGHITKEYLMLKSEHNGYLRLEDKMRNENSILENCEKKNIQGLEIEIRSLTFTLSNLNSELKNRKQIIEGKLSSIQSLKNTLTKLNRMNDTFREEMKHFEQEINSVNLEKQRKEVQLLQVKKLQEEELNDLHVAKCKLQGVRNVATKLKEKVCKEEQQLLLDAETERNRRQGLLQSLTKLEKKFQKQTEHEKKIYEELIDHLTCTQIQNDATSDRYCKQLLT